MKKSSFDIVIRGKKYNIEYRNGLSWLAVTTTGFITDNEYNMIKKYLRTEGFFDIDKHIIKHQ
jgi:hypothetical protein